MNIAIITARGGSKRIPRKNIKNFHGKPLISYSIKAALESKQFTKVIVSTDDKEIARIARDHGAEILERSDKNSDDYATTMDVLVETMQTLTSQGIAFENICCLYPTAPFVTGDDLKTSFKLFSEENFDSLLPVVKYSFPIQRALTVIDKKIHWVNKENAQTRSQDLVDHFHDTGQYYWLKKSVIAKGASIIGDNTGYIEISELEAQDIDTPSDWEIAELKYKLKHRTS